MYTTLATLDFNPLVLAEFLQQQENNFHRPANANNLTVLNIWRNTQHNNWHNGIKTGT